MSDGAGPIVRQAVEAFMARDLDGILRFADREIVVRSLAARVRAAKIVFLGFFRTEDDALEAVT